METKFALWGNGSRGNGLVGILQPQNVSVIVDSDLKKAGTHYRDIPIISPEEYVRNFFKTPIIVTPKTSEDEILSWLHGKGIKCAFSLLRENAAIEGFCLVQKDVLLRFLGIRDQACIYGLSSQTILLHNWLCANGFVCYHIFPDSLAGDMVDYVCAAFGYQVIGKEEAGRFEKILNTQPTGLGEIRAWNSNVVDCWNLTKQTDLFYNRDIEKFRGIHEGKRCFVVATGPSLRIEDLDTLHRNNEVCISMNGIIRAFEQTPWRPDYFTLSDWRMFDANKDAILQMDSRGIFISDTAWPFSGRDTVPENVYLWHFIRIQFAMGEERRFWTEFSRGGFGPGTIMTEAAIPLAMFMGCTEIYLLGADCTVANDPKKQHFVENHDSFSKVVLDLEGLFDAYKHIKSYIDQHGIKIYNATRGGALEIFPRVDFDSLF